MKIIKWIVLFLFGKYLPGYHLHKDPVKKAKGNEEGKENE